MEAYAAWCKLYGHTPVQTAADNPAYDAYIRSEAGRQLFAAEESEDAEGVWEVQSGMIVSGTLRDVVAYALALPGFLSHGQYTKVVRGAPGVVANLRIAPCAPVSHVRQRQRDIVQQQALLAAELQAAGAILRLLCS